MADEEFFKDKYFETLSKQLTGLEAGIKDLQKEVAEVKSKVIYMYGFAAALGFVASFLWQFIELLFHKQQ